MADRDDERFLRRALTQGRRGLGRTSPNPAVGAIVVRDGTVVGAGYHRRAGGPHAEVHALRAAGDAARGATLYVTLEPCNHHGRTGPCTEAVLAAGIRRVVIGVRDPNPEVAGNGARRLRRAGLDVVTGVLEAECGALVAGFAKHITTGLPRVTLKLATTLDGRIATATGDSRWITNERSRLYVHRLRTEHDAILVGANTVIADDPELTCRLAGRPNPRRVVLDGRLRIAAAAKALRRHDDEQRATIVLTGKQAPAAKLRALRAAGIEVVVLPERGGIIAWRRILRALGERGVTSLLLEGGAEVAAGALRAGVVDRVAWFIAPKLVGGDGRAALATLGVRRIARAVAINGLRLRRFGDDVLLEGEIGAPAWTA